MGTLSEVLSAKWHRKCNFFSSGSVSSLGVAQQGPGDPVASAGCVRMTKEQWGFRGSRTLAHDLLLGDSQFQLLVVWSSFFFFLMYFFSSCFPLGIFIGTVATLPIPPGVLQISV